MIHTAANVHDSKALEDAVDAIPPVRRPRERPRKRPEKLHADKAYDFPRCHKALRKRGIKSRIARRGVDSSERLERHRWVVERTLLWLNRYRRLKVRYERQSGVHQAFLELGCALICWNYMQWSYYVHSEQSEMAYYWASSASQHPSLEQFFSASSLALRSSRMEGSALSYMLASS